MMSPLERVVLVISADAALTRALVEALTLVAPGRKTESQQPRFGAAATGWEPAGSAAPPVVPMARSLEQARAQMRRARPVVIVLDAAAAPAGSRAETLDELLAAAPVVVLAGAEAADFGAALGNAVAAGEADLAARAGESVPLVAALVERRLRAALEAAHGGDEFAEILRHEVNNPLTGILGNAELLLSQSRSAQWRDRLPETFLQRLETIAELAVRLRETVRRLADAGRARIGTPAPVESRRRSA
jgi:signal transduction histidine kinase